MRLREIAQRPDAGPIAILIAMPLVMALFGREWLYTTIRSLDPWYMIGYFTYYHDSTFQADHYKLQRLPWILPGWILYQVLGPLVANFLLHVGALVVSTVFVYLTLARLVWRSSAFLVAALLTVYIPFHGSGGWDYQAAGAGAYYALTLYLLTRAAQAGEPRRLLVLAGAAFTAAVYTTIHLINFLPVLAALYFGVGRQAVSWASAKTALRNGAIGFVAVTVGLCLVNTLVGRGPFFFWPLLKIVFERLADPTGQKPWLLAWPAFFKPPGEFIYLLFLIATLCVVLARLAAAAGGWRLGRVRLLLLVQYVFLVVLWMAWQHNGHIALWPAIFAHVLVIPAFLALGGLLGGVPSPTERVPRALLVAGGALALVPALQGSDLLQLSRLAIGLTEEVGTAIVAATALLTALGFMLAHGLPSRIALLLTAASFTFAYLHVESRWGMIVRLGNQGERYWTRDGCVSHERTYREILRLFRILRSENPVLWQTWLWRGHSGERDFGQDCRIDLNRLRGSTHSTGISNLGLPSDTHPSQISDEYVGYVSDGGLVAAMVQYDHEADGLVERFAKAGKTLTFVRREVINLGKVPVVVLIYRSRHAH